MTKDSTMNSASEPAMTASELKLAFSAEDFRKEAEHCAVYDEARRAEMFCAAAAQARELAELRKLVYVPGQWRCAKCKCVVIKAVICADSGDVGMKADSKTDICPNGCGPLWPVTERQAGNELCDRLDRVNDELAAIKAKAITREELLLAMSEVDSGNAENAGRVLDRLISTGAVMVKK